MSDYTRARSTKMLATHCAICARPLRDANSVECGIGPDCRKRFGYDRSQGEPNWNEAIQLLDGFVPMVEIAEWNLDARRAVNVLIHRIAYEQVGDAVVAMVQAVRALGYVMVADRIAERLTKIVIVDCGNHYELTSPYNQTAVSILRGVPGRWWDGDRRVTTFPKTSHGALRRALNMAYPNALYLGPNGLRMLSA